MSHWLSMKRIPSHNTHTTLTNTINWVSCATVFLIKFLTGGVLELWQAALRIGYFGCIFWSTFVLSDKNRRV
jgi:hypothetical protein